MQPHTTAIVVTHESAATVGDTISVIAELYTAGELEVVLVDNASTDGTADLVRWRFPWVHVVASPTNTGFGRACNLGFQFVRTPFVLLLNPDARLAPHDLMTLVRFMESRRNAGIVAPAIRESNGCLQHAGTPPTPWQLIRGAAGQPVASTDRRTIRPGQPPFKTRWVCGAIQLIRSDLFRKLGGFDPRFFLYFEETDFCLRVVREGAEIWAIGEAVAEHHGGYSASRTGRPMYRGAISDHYFRSRFYFLVKHYGWLAATASEIAEIVIIGARSLRNSVTGRRASGELAERMRAPILRLPAKTT